MYNILKILTLSLFVLLTACAPTMDIGGVYGPNRSYTNTQMGVRYLLGRGVKQSDERAFYYFGQGAKGGDAFAQNELAYLYAAGKGTPRNLTAAFGWYQKAADHGLVSAQYSLGLMYLHGWGVAPNKERALFWIKKSAEHGFEPARAMLSQWRT
ncbi:MAG TPA: tetratricopeptide repeat protein [Gammaproteobacteria bacterium]|nr:tetratricopeptide repeat protein [Gammaproteobacteria bacterium]